ncbi:MAG: 4Fe-4S binding protein [Clostridia bacterium]|nr:4Fe-4S binding protein [Clostridia bacterium]MBR7032018.1 4Fe-4S binding protein [Clostridia bacterium]
MNKVTFNEERCKGCGLCVDVCPRGIVVILADKLNGKGYHPASVSDQEKCIACAMCATMCPDSVIKVEKDV